MSEVNVLNAKFEKSSSLTSPVSLDADKINVGVVHQIVKATLAGRRQGTACTKSRGMVNGGGAKPFKQKGTGRARQGTSRSPLMPGGGVVFGPTPRSYKQKINKKMMNNAIQSIIADKFQAGKLHVVEKLESNGKTKEMYALLNGKGLLPGLVITQDKNSPALRAVKNLQWGKGAAVEGFSVYEAVKFENLIIEKQALETLLNRLV